MRSQVRIALAALTGLLAASPGAAVMCGDTITDSQTLTANLSCPGITGVTIDEGGALDMNGFGITCTGASIGVSLHGEGGKLSNGFIKGCSTAGVATQGEKHKIDHVVVSGSGSGFSIGSPNTKISDCAALNNTNWGFYLGPPGGSLTRILAKNNASGGIQTQSGPQKITDASIAWDNSGGATGIVLYGEGIKVSKVRITNASTGISVSGQFNKISDVTSLNHTVDGIYMIGNSNQLKKCVVHASDTANSGVTIGGGSDNSVSGCRSTGSDIGINVDSGSGHVISKNKVFGSGTTGVSVTFSNNCVIKGNLAVGSGTVDLSESVPGCANSDAWEKNIGSRNDNCIE